MERKIGETFEFEGKTYKTIQSLSDDCRNCAFADEPCYECTLSEILGGCSKKVREDKKNIIFKEIKSREIKDNELTINIPSGMEIDLQNSNFGTGVIKFKKKEITYEDIENPLGLEGNWTGIPVDDSNVFKLCAIDRLMNIARYYNGDWKPDWDNPEENKYYIYRIQGSYDISWLTVINFSVVIFKNKEDAQAVIDNPHFRGILDAIFKN